MTTESIHPDIVTRLSPWPVGQTVEHLLAAIGSRGMTVFSTIDQRAAARAVGQDLRETVLIVFGSPVAGTPVMAAHPLAALDLPLKLLVWDDAGRSCVSYLDPAALAARYDMDPAIAAPLASIEHLLAAVLTEPAPGSQPAAPPIGAS